MTGFVRSALQGFEASSSESTVQAAVASLTGSGIDSVLSLLRCRKEQLSAAHGVPPGVTDALAAAALSSAPRTALAGWGEPVARARGTVVHTIPGAGAATLLAPEAERPPVAQALRGQPTEPANAVAIAPSPALMLTAAAASAAADALAPPAAVRLGAAAPTLAEPGLKAVVTQTMQALGQPGLAAFVTAQLAWRGQITTVAALRGRPAPDIAAATSIGQLIVERLQATARDLVAGG
ncbi:hypothetical protein MNEG_7875 [Monoraphidium neglectum]|uniref:Uncharacterized protein n=1 Tax=Monoraphidium neglectum TaxID=145388 RepID=A0A0D2M9V8_9CHLO|nr:hypothetical protein MNEG_7875 [Monoraphidium neglectum]KIZ00085.1 hypothetical protein MNEG_7875 [Monoraphidium neglectum]|eukprot:XP_013899104.1 hypothetical protein MNEG_7875 [Monoraphidium neglectum]